MRATAARPSEPRIVRVNYTIRSGDTLSLVALRFGTTVEQLVELNPGIDATNLPPGRRLRVG